MRMVTTHVVKVLVGKDWVQLPGQRAGQTFEEAQAIYEKRTAAANEQKDIFKQVVTEERVNPTRR